MRAHIVNGEFQSDKYPTCPAGKVPLSVKDPTAQDLLWEYAQRRRVIDSEFADDLETCLREARYLPIADAYAEVRALRADLAAEKAKVEIAVRALNDIEDATEDNITRYCAEKTLAAIAVVGKVST